MKIKENNKYIRAFWGVIPHIIILISFIIIAWSMTHAANWNHNTAMQKGNAVISHNNSDLVKTLTKSESSEEISNIYFYVIPSIVIVIDIVIIRYWKKKNQDINNK